MKPVVSAVAECRFEDFYVPTTVMSRSRDVVTTSVADQFEPVLRVYEEIRASTRAVVDVPLARSRVAAGRAAFDPVKLLSRARTMAGALDRAIDAFELAGLASTTVAMAVRDGRPDARRLAIAWASNEATGSTAPQRLARRAAGVVAGALLRKNAQAVTRGLSMAAWTRAVCPCCGGSPDLALVENGERSLVCSRCDTRWTAGGRGCLGCEAATSPALARVKTPYLGYDLVVCNACGRYLKERAGSLRFHPLVERALTTEMDAAAERRGLRL